MKTAAEKTYGRKGRDVVEKNWAAIDAGAKNVVKVDVPESWGQAEGEEYDVVVATGARQKVNAQEGNTVPVSAAGVYANGATPSGAAAYEKRGIAVNVPVWASENCIQCTFCSYVCPHAAIRPMALTDDECAKLPEGTVTIPLMGMPGYKFAIVVSSLDCTGCARKA